MKKTGPLSAERGPICVSDAEFCRHTEAQFVTIAVGIKTVEKFLQFQVYCK